MTNSARTLTFLGSDAVFIAVSFFLFLHPGQGLYFYPFYGTIFFWSGARQEAETPVIFIFLATFVGFFLISRLPSPNTWPLALEIAGLWSLALGVSAARESDSQSQREALKETAAIEARIQDCFREKSYYLSYEKEASAQIRLRRELAESAKSIGSALDAAEVRARLVSILSSRFPESLVSVQDSIEGDSLLRAAASKKGPAVIRDSTKEMSGAAFSSALAVPLSVMRQSAGFLKIESSKKDAFSLEDIKTADLLATVAALSLENIRFYQQIQAQAVRDPLTRLYSHKAFQERLQEEILRSGRSQMPVSLVLGDLDYFKNLNDRYGHQAGDALLRAVAAIMTGVCRPVDFPARYGGEEFALILPGLSIEEALVLAEKIRARIESETSVFSGARTQATMSLGVASFPQDATSASQLVRAADERLYRAKSSGRNQVSR
ncbi:MAG: sensor domain-containing diguanylate cyclase [Elusimicrobiota bacterium]